MKDHIMDFMEMEDWEVIENLALGELDLKTFRYSGSPGYNPDDFFRARL